MKQSQKIIVIIASIMTIAHSTADAGNRWKGKWYFSKKCSFCHSVSLRQESEETGPHIRHIMGREVAARSDTQYSSHLLLLKKHGVRWTPDLLRQFINKRDGSWFDYYRKKFLKNKCISSQTSMRHPECAPYTTHNKGRRVSTRDLEDIISYLKAFKWYFLKT